MKVTVDILRTTKIKTNDIISILGFTREEQRSIKEINVALYESFGPMADGFKILWNSDENLDPKSEELIVGIGVFRFSMNDVENIGSSESLFHYMDKMNEKDITRIDGALFSELNRLGIYTSVEQYVFKAIMKTEGN